jgi:Ni2+-binding GTPase involved in maturation of urease and hydrogenase
VPVFFLSAATGEGMDEWFQWLRDQVAAIKA